MDQQEQSKPQYLIYSSKGGDFDVKLPENMSFLWWRPGWLSIIPPGVGYCMVVWWVFHMCRVFRNQEYAVLYIRHLSYYVHYSCVLPGYIRWPFMGKNDLQISNTWTFPAYAGRGFATCALQKIISDLKLPGRQFWYVSREANPGSIAVAKKARFTLHSYAQRTSRFGSRLLGQLLPVSAKDPGVS